MTDTVTVNGLRAANIARQAEWDPSDKITLSYRLNELAGETGEACNVGKKIERERLGIRGSRDTLEHLGEELADVVICADLVAMAEGIDLDAAIEAKFNATSEKVGLSTRLLMTAAPKGEPLKAMIAAITKVAMIAEAWGDGAGEPSVEIAGGILAYLAANPAEIETFLVNPSLEQSLAACRPENWCLTWRAQTGEIMDREMLADYLAKHKGPQ